MSSGGWSAPDVLKQEQFISEPYERLAFDHEGRVLPVYSHVASAKYIQWRSEPGFSPLSPPPIVEAFNKLEPHCHAVVRGCCFYLEGPRKSFFFTAFFVSPTILVTAQHCLHEQGQVPSSIRIFRGSYAPGWQIEQYGQRADILFEPPITIVSEPVTGRLMEGHNFAFLRVNHYEHPTYLLPSTVAPVAGDQFFTIQYNGLPTTEFLSAHSELLREGVQLGEGEVKRMLLSDHRSVSVGTINAVNQMQISYSVSTGGGASGAPGISLSSLDRFCAIHVGTLWKDKAHTIFDPAVPNSGVNVSDPLFIAAYAKHVKPSLPKVPQDVDDFFK